MPLMLKKTLLLVFILTFILSNEAFSEENQKDEGVFRRVFRGLSISPGICLKSPEIKIKRKSDGHRAVIGDPLPGMVSLAIDISSRDFDFPNTNFGASLFLHSSHFKADRQWAAVNGDEVDIEDVGTSLSGHYSYLIPALYYKHQPGEVEWKLGVGLG